MKNIIVPKRDAFGWLKGTEMIEVKWNCPVCGGKMGEPKLESFCEDGEFYSVHVWENKCGHIAKYKDLERMV